MSKRFKQFKDWFIDGLTCEELEFAANSLHIKTSDDAKRRDLLKRLWKDQKAGIRVSSLFDRFYSEARKEIRGKTREQCREELQELVEKYGVRGVAFVLIVNPDGVLNEIGYRLLDESPARLPDGPEAAVAEPQNLSAAQNLTAVIVAGLNEIERLISQAAALDEAAVSAALERVNGTWQECLALRLVREGVRSRLAELLEVLSGELVSSLEYHRLTVAVPVDLESYLAAEPENYQMIIDSLARLCACCQETAVLRDLRVTSLAEEEERLARLLKIRDQMEAVAGQLNSFCPGGRDCPRSAGDGVWSGKEGDEGLAGADRSCKQALVPPADRAAAGAGGEEGPAGSGETETQHPERPAVAGAEAVAVEPVCGDGGSPSQGQPGVPQQMIMQHAAPAGQESAAHPAGAEPAAEPRLFPGEPAQEQEGIPVTCRALTSNAPPVGVTVPGSDDGEAIRTGYYEEFMRLEGELYDLLKSHKHLSSVVSSLSRGQSLGGLNMGRVPASRYREVKQGLDAWLKLKGCRKTGGGEEMAACLAALLEYIGLSDLQLQLKRQDEQQSAYFTARSSTGASPLRLEAAFQPQGRLDLVLVFGRFHPDNLACILDSYGLLSRFPLIFFLGRLSPERRREWKSYCCGEGLNSLLADELLIFFLASVAGPRLPAFISCAAAVAPEIALAVPDGLASACVSEAG